MEHIVLDKLNYWIFIVLMMLGLWAMISKNNLIKKVMGMSIFQSAVILFYVSIAAKQSGADIPIYPHDLIHPEQHGDVSSLHEPIIDEPHSVEGLEQSQRKEHRTEDMRVTPLQQDRSSPRKTHQRIDGKAAHHPIAESINSDNFDNPLPHVLMLTAIVVGVATLGVALALIQRIYRIYGSIEENVVITKIENDTSDDGTISTDNVPGNETADSHA